MKKTEIVFLITICMFFTYLNNHENIYLHGQSNNLPDTNLIKKYIKPNVKHYEFKNVSLFRKIMVGKWSAAPHSGFTFRKDGSFTLLYTEFGKKIKNGIWKVDKKSIHLKFNSDSVWRDYMIEFYELRKKEKNSDAPYKYFFAILLKKDDFWGGGVSINFN